MCTVIITVPARGGDPVRLLAIRDEDPERSWDRLGRSWPDLYPGVVGIRDARAGGAWLAADPTQRRLSVLLNRLDLSDRPDTQVHTRGTIALESVAGHPPAGEPATRGFNLVEVTAAGARVISWDGIALRALELAPGTHMVAHDDVDDLDTARIAAWLPQFRDAGDAQLDPDAPWWDRWVSIVAQSAHLPGDDERAIIRRQSFEGVPSYSLLVCVASVGADALVVHDAPLETPGTWSPLDLE